MLIHEWQNQSKPLIYRHVLFQGSRSSKYSPALHSNISVSDADVCSDVVPSDYNGTEQCISTSDHFFIWKSYLDALMITSDLCSLHSLWSHLEQLQALKAPHVAKDLYSVPLYCLHHIFIVLRYINIENYTAIASILCIVTTCIELQSKSNRLCHLT